MTKKKKVFVSYGASFASIVLLDSYSWTFWSWQSDVLISLLFGGCFAGIVAMLVLMKKDE